MKNLTLSIVALMIVASAGYAQNVEFKSSNFKDKKEEFKKAFTSYQAGDAPRAAGNTAILETKSPDNNFRKALFHYEKAYAFNPNSAKLNYKMGNCYLYTNQKYKAYEHLDKAIKLDPKSLDDEFYFYYGQACMLHGDFKKAIDQFKKYEAAASKSRIEQRSKFLKKYKKDCAGAKAIIEKPERVWVDNLESINSAQDEYGPCISTDGETLIFTSNRKNSHAADEIGEYDSDMYTSTFANKKWSAPKNMSSVNTDGDETSSALSYDGQKMLLFKEDANGNADLYQSILEGLDWQKPASLSKVINTDYDQTYAAYNFNDVKVYYITDQRGGGGKAGMDIFFSGNMDRENNYWGKGQTAGMNINTKFNEGSVYLHPDGETMYFCSEGHNSLGGYDIFVSTKYQGQWQKPKNLGYPINTPYDDFFFAATANGKYAYIASNREGGKGGLDLYRVTFWGPEKPVIGDTEDYLLASIAEPIQDTYIEKEVKVEKKSLTVFKGKVIDAISRKPLAAEIDITDNGKGEVISTVKSNTATGKFLLSLPAGVNYGITVKKEGYLFHSENFDLPAASEFNMVNKDVELKNIAIGSKIALRNVFFETGKSDIKPDSHSELARLIQLLKDVPGLKIELSGHTDNKGSEKLNKTLSQSRAQAVVDYLTKKGISASRLTAKGYGSSQPVADNKTADGRQQNRRTEFMITGN